MGFKKRKTIPENQKPTELNQYPQGTDVLWMAHYREDPDGGDMNGMAVKLSGTLEEAARQAQVIAIEYNMIMQCLRRRY